MYNQTFSTAGKCCRSCPVNAIIQFTFSRYCSYSFSTRLDRIGIVVPCLSLLLLPTSQIHRCTDTQTDLWRARRTSDGSKSGRQTGSKWKIVATTNEWVITTPRTHRNSLINKPTMTSSEGSSILGIRSRTTFEMDQSTPESSSQLHHKKLVNVIDSQIKIALSFTNSSGWLDLIVNNRQRELADRIVKTVDWSWILKMKQQPLVEYLPLYQLFLLCKFESEDFSHHPTQIDFSYRPARWSTSSGMPICFIRENTWRCIRSWDLLTLASFLACLNISQRQRMIHTRWKRTAWLRFWVSCCIYAHPCPRMF